MNYQESRDYIKDAEKYGAVLGLSNIRELAGRLGNPQDALSVIHVAGTNGKGSVIAYLYQTLQLTGRKVGRYISPTLFSYRERMEINQTPVSREQFADLMTRVKKAAEEMVRDGLTHPTPFELETAAAFLFFKEEKCDLVLLEVGMGGSLDATNIVEKPLLSVLASISMDHMAYLGGTLYEIAEKKAGIIKKGCPMITIKQQPEAEKAIRAACREKQVPFREADPSEAEVITAGIEEQTFRYKGEEYTIRLGGAYQKENACLALAALEILSENGICTTVDERKKGLYQTRWKGRFTVLSREPLFIVDGAHNPAGADMLARTISQHFQGKKIYFITGMFADKDYSYVMQKMCPFAEKILTIQTPDNPRALSAKELAECARKYHPDVTAMPEIGAAVNKAYELAGKEDVILAFGSLSFISAICDAAEKRKSRPEPGEKEDTMDLQECRKRIDSIDDEIVRLFEERMKVSEEIARFKIQTGKKVMDPQREREKLEAVRKKAHGPLNELGAREVFRQIMAVSRKRQYQMLTENGIKEPVEYRFVDRLPLRDVTVVFQGVEGAYSSAAMREYFPEEIESYHVKTWRDAMEEVSQGRADYAVLPIENSTAGAVGDIYDLLMEYNLYIVGEQIIKVDHVLLGLPGATLGSVKRVYSHPQGLLQCKEYLESHPEWKVSAVENTAEGAKKVKIEGDPGGAAIASREAGRVFGLTILAEKICKNRENATRFVIVSRNPIYEEGAGHISICFELPHESGTLYNMLSHIIYNDLNMTKIESRPLPGKTWEYRFFVDFEGNLKDDAVINALSGLKSESLLLRILGNY